MSARESGFCDEFDALVPMPDPGLADWPDVLARASADPARPRHLLKARLGREGSTLAKSGEAAPTVPRQAGRSARLGQVTAVATVTALVGVAIAAIAVRQLSGQRTGVPATVPMIGRLVFADNGRIVTSAPDGTVRHVLTSTRPPMHDGEPEWSPDGSQIAFVRARSGSTHAWYVMNADGSDLRPIPHAAGPGGDVLGRAAWSPDGNRLAFAAGSPSRIYTINVDGTNLAQLRQSPAGSLDPSWSPDGERIAFAACTDAACDGSDLYALRSNGSNLRLIVRGGFNYAPAFSPDGRRLLFERMSPRHASLGTFVVAASGGRPVRILPAPPGFAGGSPTWSPDGVWIAVSAVHSNDPVSSELYVARPDGTDLRRVARGGAVDWGPAR
jgi:hypothetical protein